MREVRFVRVGPDQRRLLNELEAAITGIRHPVDEAGMFHHQCLMAIQHAGFSATREVLLEDGRRVDIVVVNARGTVAIELEAAEVSRSTLAKALDLPREVLRMVVFRNRQDARVRIVGVDRIVCVRADLRMLPLLVTGEAPLDQGPDLGRAAVVESIGKLGLRRRMPARSRPSQGQRMNNKVRLRRVP